MSDKILDDVTVNTVYYETPLVQAKYDTTLKEESSDKAMKIHVTNTDEI